MSHLKRVAYSIEVVEAKAVVETFRVFVRPEYKLVFPGNIGSFNVYSEAICFDTEKYVRWYEDTLREGFEDVKAHRAFFEFCRTDVDGASGVWAEIGDAGYDDWEEDSFGEPTIGPAVELTKSIEWSY